MSIVNYIFFSIWFFLPAGIANMMPIFSARMPFLQRFHYPIDFGKTFRGKRIFGDHKTWRGLITGIVFATLTLWLQQLSAEHIEWLRVWTQEVNYPQLPVLLMGPVFGIGALMGDAIESFFKRQVGIKPGDGWFPFDQTDYIIGGALATIPFVPLSAVQYLWLIVIWFLLHIISNVVGYLLGIRDKPI